MPSIFHPRRASVSHPPSDPLEDDPSSPTSLRNKRRSMDVGRPPVSGNKFKEFFKGSNTHNEVEKNGRRRTSSISQMGNDDDHKGSLRKRLSSASQIFSSKPPQSPEPTNGNGALQTPLTPSRPPGTGARYDDPAPRSPRSTTQFASPTLFPENFSLSNTASPEGEAGRRGSISWQPSYPTVLPDDSYADLAPDGHPAIENVTLSPSPSMPSENEHRRSLLEALEANGQMPTPSPDDVHNRLDPRKYFGANGQIPTPSPDEQPRAITPPPPPQPAPPLTPPPSATSPNKTLAEPQSPRARRPTLSLQMDPPVLDSTILAPPISATDSVPPSPSNAKLNGKSRPDMPLRKATLIQSPPMPQPIKNLPSMVGWPAFMKEGGPGTPAWGQLAKDNAPRTPGWGGGAVPKTPGWAAMTSPLSARTPATPGGSGFPFALPQTTVGQNKGKGKEQMSAEELRKARRAMVSRSSGFNTDVSPSCCDNRRLCLHKRTAKSEPVTTTTKSLRPRWKATERTIPSQRRRPTRREKSQQSHSRIA